MLFPLEGGTLLSYVEVVPLLTIANYVQHSKKTKVLPNREFLEQEVTIKLQRPKRSPRRISSQPHPIDWQCGSCGCSDANQFRRSGHYRRQLETGCGHLETLRVPMPRMVGCCELVARCMTRPGTT